jgi:two-component sensor histidine kinase
LAQPQSLESQNRFLVGLLEKAAANTIERDVADRIQSVLTEELHHRMKNMLAVVTAIVRQSIRTSDNLATAERTIAARLMAMASAHDLLLKVDWKIAKLKAIVSGALEQHNTGLKRIVVEGEEIDIVSGAVVPITLLLNELCTNAVKYGALSNENGHVLLTWARTGASVTVRWVERDGPAVTPPGRKSFGTRLIEDALPRQLGGRGTLSFPASGVEFELMVPVQNLVAPNVQG